MVKSKSGNILVIFGLCLIAFYLVVRLFYIQGISDALAKAQVYGLGNTESKDVSGYLFAYIVWSYSFKLGMFLTIIGCSLKAGMENHSIFLFIIGGILYLSLCYIPIGYYPIFFGIQGTITIFLFLFIVWYWMKKRPQLDKTERYASDFRLIGYYFFIVATWNLCGVFGIATYALKPEIMIKHGLQSKAIMLASHVMIEFLLGWLFIFLSMYKEYSISKKG